MGIKIKTVPVFNILSTQTGVNAFHVLGTIFCGSKHIRSTVLAISGSSVEYVAMTEYK